jgi:hypothetical protein
MPGSQIKVVVGLSRLTVASTQSHRHTSAFPVVKMCCRQFQVVGTGVVAKGEII